MNRTEDWSRVSGVVTGAGSGIGAATVGLLTSYGADVVGVDLSSDGLAQTAKRVQSNAGQFAMVCGDVCEDSIQSRALELAARNGRVDFLVNNAAVFLLAGVTASAEQWKRTIDVNVVAGARFVSKAVPYLELSARASVVNIASISAHRAQADRWTYNSSKGAVLELTRCQALDLPRIRFNSVSPGWIWTEVLEEASQGDREKWEATWGSYAPAGRCGEPHEVAEGIAFLLSTRSSFVNGIDLPIDGGYLATSPEGPAVLALGK